MGIFDKFKNALSMSEDDFGEISVDEEEDYSYPKSYSSRRSKKQDEAPADNVVDMNSTLSQRSSQQASAKAHVVFEKIDSFNEVNQVADVLIEQRIVILNLETCSDEDSIRILDVLSGVNYANNGTIQRIAGRAYIITPNNVPLTGELLDEVATSAAQNRVL